MLRFLHQCESICRSNIIFIDKDFFALLYRSPIPFLRNCSLRGKNEKTAWPNF